MISDTPWFTSLTANYLDGLRIRLLHLMIFNNCHKDVTKRFVKSALRKANLLQSSLLEGRYLQDLWFCCRFINCCCNGANVNHCHGIIWREYSKCMHVTFTYTTHYTHLKCLYPMFISFHQVSQ